MCDRPWPGDDHFGKRCAELDAEQQVETRIRKV